MVMWTRRSPTALDGPFDFGRGQDRRRNGVEGEAFVLQIDAQKVANPAGSRVNGKPRPGTRQESRYGENPLGYWVFGVSERNI
jgi:hypothetical protein